MSSDSTFPLLEYANELLVSIAEQIDDRETLRSLARTCSRLQVIAEALLYRHICHNASGQMERLQTSLKRRRARLRAIQAIETKCCWEKTSGLNLLVPILHETGNLRALKLESGFANLPWADRTEVQRTMRRILMTFCGRRENSLPNLKEFTLHFSARDYGYWSLNEEISSIFTHPSLEKIYLACANVMFYPIAGPEKHYSTPLKVLELSECHIDYQSLKSVLVYPKALESLRIGENCFHHDSRMQHDLLTPSILFSCLNQQRHSLRSLSFAFNRSRTESLDAAHLDQSCLGFQQFASLETLTLSGESTWLQTILSRPRTYPPNLKTVQYLTRIDYGHLNYAHVVEDVYSDCHWMAYFVKNIPSLKSVSISLLYIPERAPSLDDDIRGLATFFQENRVIFRVFRQLKHNYFPPHIFRERAYDEEMMFGPGKGLDADVEAHYGSVTRG